MTVLKVRSEKVKQCIDAQSLCFRRISFNNVLHLHVLQNNHPLIISLAAVSLKLGHCYFLRDFFDALCSNYFGKMFFSNYEKTGGGGGG